jgi:crossover junction endodeoxyribonuclease RusA
MLELPWPPKELSPNARIHWAKKSRITKQYRTSCGWLAKQVKVKLPEGDTGLRITFCPPDKHKRDKDNCVASFKAGQDGLADGWGVNDTRFNPVTYAWGKVTPGGKVIIEVM